LDTAVIAMLLNCVILFALVLASWLLNVLLRRPLVNGWCVGIFGVLAMSAYTAWRLTAAGAGFKRGQHYGEYVIGFALFPILPAAWCAKRFQQRKRETLAAQAQAAWRVAADSQKRPTTR
jgi:hypothetical protein